MTATMVCAGLLIVISFPGCVLWPANDSDINPFHDLPPVALDGQPHLLSFTIAPLGPLEKDQVVRLKVEGEAVDAVLILTEDEQFDEAGVLAGGGPSNTFFDYQAQIAGRYFVFVLFDPASPEILRRATLTGMPGPSAFAPPVTQAVLVSFEEDFLTNPGLVDPESFTDEERQVLVEITPMVRRGIIARLRTIFANTPIEILEEGDPLPATALSRLTLRARRELVEDEDVFFDSAVPPLDAEHSQCQDRVVFGEVLPRGTMVDPGNHVHDDEAVVYVGSFQGRGQECRSAATNSANNIVLGLAHTAAHEIGHLVGLYHVTLVDIMNRSPSQAFQRELTFQQGQISIETPAGYMVLTTVIQDPDLYFRTNFGR